MKKLDTNYSSKIKLDQLIQESQKLHALDKIY